jgi:hypothetical protein
VQINGELCWRDWRREWGLRPPEAPRTYAWVELWRPRWKLTLELRRSRHWRCVFWREDWGIRNLFINTPWLAIWAGMKEQKR